MGLKTIIVSVFLMFSILGEASSKCHPGIYENSHIIYPQGKPRIPHLPCCQGFAVCYYGFILDALDLQHPRLLQR